MLKKFSDKNKAFIRILCFIIFFVFVFMWQNAYRNDASELKGYSEQSYKSVCGVGIENEYLTFVYGLYFWDMFPLYPIRQKLPKMCDNNAYFFSRKGADDIFEKGGYALKNDFHGLVRSGVDIPYFIPYLTAKINGTIFKASFLPFNFWVFIFSLLVFNICFWINGRSAFAIFFTLFAGSYKFQLYNVYVNENIFSFFISIFICLLGLCSFFVFNKKIKQWLKFFLMIVCGMITALFVALRMDMFAVVPAVCFIVLMYKRDCFYKRIILMSCFLLVFFLGLTSLKTFIRNKKLEAVEVCKQKGGDYLKGGVRTNHVFWHTLWVFAQEFGQNDPHQRTDFYAAYAAKQRMHKKYGIKTPPIPYINKQRDLYMLSHPMYDKMMRELYIEDVLANPFGFIRTLFYRAFIVFEEGGDVQIKIGKLVLGFPSRAWVYGIFFVVLVVSKRKMYLKMFGYFLFTMVIPVFVGLVGKFQYMSVIGIFLYAFIFMIIGENIVKLFLNRQKRLQNNG